MIALKLLLPQKVSKGMGPQWQWAIRCKQNRFCCRFYNLHNEYACADWAIIQQIAIKYHSLILEERHYGHNPENIRVNYTEKTELQTILNKYIICKLIFECSMNSVAVFFPLRVTIFSDSKWSQLTCLAVASDVIWLNFSLSGILHDRNVSNKFLASSKIACRKICLVDHRNRYYILPGA